LASAHSTMFSVAILPTSSSLAMGQPPMPFIALS
jgi:hypothetical protein